VISTFMETAVLLKHLVFERTASVSPQLLLVAGLCFQNMAHMLMCWNKELVQPGGTVSGSSMHAHHGCIALGCSVSACLSERPCKEADGCAVPDVVAGCVPSSRRR
jgi:hypothetical protein